ncbi:MAG: helix-turn-helix domain-containing protein [Desulfobacterium sp.]|nr:helix-turn-helix domain-containing protein [Desulfobacterium sp.]
MFKIKSDATIKLTQVEQVRINKAASYLEDMTISMEQVTDLSGFGSAGKMRRAFRRNLNVLPGKYRNRFGI